MILTPYFLSSSILAPPFLLDSRSFVISRNHLDYVGIEELTSEANALLDNPQILWPSKLWDESTASLFYTLTDSFIKLWVRITV